MFDQVNVDRGPGEETCAESGDQLEQHENSGARRWNAIAAASFKRLLRPPRVATSSLGHPQD